MQTKIEWADTSWNPIKMRCTPVSEGCAHCYARRILSRNLPGFTSYPKEGELPKLDEKELEKPLSWKKPRMVFVESMGDLFHELVDWEDVFKVWEVMEKCPQHTFMILTKRPEFAKDFDFEANISDESVGIFPWRVFGDNANIWLGVSVENQEQADKRIPVLLQIPAAVRFVSVEPMLEPVDLRCVQTDVVEIDVLTGNHGVYRPLEGRSNNKLSWVVYGPETGPNKRPFDIQWGLDLQRQCQDAGVPVFAKKLLHPEMIREMPKFKGGANEKRCLEI